MTVWRRDPDRLPTRRTGSDVTDFTVAFRHPKPLIRESC